jgi:hypothetical protein
VCGAIPGLPAAVTAELEAELPVEGLWLAGRGTELDGRRFPRPVRGVSGLISSANTRAVQRASHQVFGGNQPLFDKEAFKSSKPAFLVAP